MTRFLFLVFLRGTLGNRPHFIPAFPRTMNLVEHRPIPCKCLDSNLSRLEGGALYWSQILIPMHDWILFHGRSRCSDQ